MSTLEIKGLHASVGDKEILKGIDLTINSGEVHAIMGPNGAGKSTLSAVIMGKPGYTVTAGSITLDGVDMLTLPTWQRATAGLHLVMQYPTEVPGVHVDEMLTEALKSRKRDTASLTATISKEAGRINFDADLVSRALNVDLSGGEKKRNEHCSLVCLNPRSPSSTNSTPVSTSTHCVTAPSAWKPQHTKPTLVFSPSRTTCACWKN